MLIRYVGLGVHKDSIKIAVAEEGREPARLFASIPGDTNKLIARIRKLGSKSSLRCCYEAGPGGYTVYRSLTAAGIDYNVIAPFLIPKQSGKRVADRQARCRESRSLPPFRRSHRGMGTG